jgi:hypothetical protein
MNDDAPKATAKRREDFGARKQAIFLDNLKQYGSVFFAAKQAGINKTTAYRHRESDPEFAAAWEAAKDDALDLLEATAHKRAHSTSDTLLIFLLKAGRPAKYREIVYNRHGGEDGGPVLHEVRAIDYRDSIAALAPGPMGDSEAPGEDQGPLDG